MSTIQAGNAATITPSHCLRLLPTLYKLRRSFFLKGPVGVGKSSIVAQFCTANKLEMRDVRLSQMDPTDIKGFPSPDAAKNLMRWLPPDFLPTDKKSKGVLFLDELTSAPTAVQASAYQLMLDRKVGSYILPPGWSVGAAGNREIDRSIVNRQPAALANRMIHLNIDASLECWVPWAMANGITPTTVAYLRFEEKNLHNFDPQSAEAAFPTPRSWVFADEVMREGLPPVDAIPLLRGAVGPAATNYWAFAQMMAELPTRDEIAMDPEHAPIPEKPDARLATATMLSMAAKDVSAFKTFLTYMQRMNQEMQVIFMRDMLAKGTDVPVKTTPEFTKWAVANSDVML